MTQTALGLLSVEADDREVRFRFAEPRTSPMEVPGSLEKEITEHLATNVPDLASKRFVVDLDNLPAVSSRQLGILLTIRKACQPYGNVELRSVSDSVRYLMHMTRMAGYFGLTDEA